MRSFFVAVVAACLVVSSFAAEGKFDYRPMAEWDGACGAGDKQSPINIDAAAATEASKEQGRIEVETMGTLKDYTVYFTGVSLEVAFEKWSVDPDVRIPANDYTIGESTKVKPGDMLAVEPLQMHYHTLSEHTFDGFYAPGELHIVTKVKDGESDHCDDSGGCLAVFGIMTAFEGDGDKTNEALQGLFTEMPSGVGVENGIPGEAKLNLDDFLPKGKDYYTYLGSLTTPPCSEIVTWHVFTDSIPISAENVEMHQYLVSSTPGDDCTFNFFGVCSPPREKTNYRPVQPLAGRSLTIVAEK